MESRRAAALRRQMEVDAAMRLGRETAVRVLRRVRKEALRDGNREEAADYLGQLWFLSLRARDEQLRLARKRAVEAQSPMALTNLGHALALADQPAAAQRAYEQAVSLAVSAPNELDMEVVKEARQAIECIRQNLPIPFVEAARRQDIPHAAAVFAFHSAERVAKADPSAQAYQSLGFALEALDRFDEALDAYEIAASLAVAEGEEAMLESLAAKVRLLRRDLKRDA